MSETVIADLLRWYLEMGVDETIGFTPSNRFSNGQAEVTADVSPQQSGNGARQRPSKQIRPQPAVPSSDAYERARAVSSLADLRAVLAEFDGCALKATATNLVFGDGVPTARVVFIGEAPGAEEDRQGLPFVGASGRLLDRMLASVGLDRRKNVFISNTVFWRPPGNRQPTSWEIAVCQPFLARIIELIRPQLLVALGGPAATTLVGLAESVGRLRGRWFSYKSESLPAAIPLRVLFHPAYLLRSPSQKRLAWHDLLAIQEQLESKSKEVP
ncbi:MAG: uracil-DNA glycosylase [Rhodospirillales bacterium]